MAPALQKFVSSLIKKGYAGGGGVGSGAGQANAGSSFDDDLATICSGMGVGTKKSAAGDGNGDGNGDGTKLAGTGGDGEDDAAIYEAGNARTSYHEMLAEHSASMGIKTTPATGKAGKVPKTPKAKAPPPPKAVAGGAQPLGQGQAAILDMPPPPVITAEQKERTAYLDSLSKADVDRWLVSYKDMRNKRIHKARFIVEAAQNANSSDRDDSYLSESFLHVYIANQITNLLPALRLIELSLYHPSMSPLLFESVEQDIVVSLSLIHHMHHASLSSTATLLQIRKLESKSK